MIHGFFARTKEALAAVDPDLKFGAYTGAWYPSYYEVGVNWADPSFDASQEFDWATPEYGRYGYADLLDLYTNGNYYWPVTVEEYRRGNGAHRNETDSEVSRGDHLSVEGAAASRGACSPAVPSSGASTSRTTAATACSSSVPWR